MEWRKTEDCGPELTRKLRIYIVAETKQVRINWVGGHWERMDDERSVKRIYIGK